VNTSTHESLKYTPPDYGSAGCYWHHFFTDDKARYEAATLAAKSNGTIIGHLEWNLEPDAYHRNTTFRYRNFCLWVLFYDIEKFVAYLKARNT